MHLFFCYGVHELNLCCMQKQPFVRCSVQPVSYDRGIHSVRMSGMYAQLVCAAGAGVEIHEDRSVFPMLTDTIIRNGRFAVRMIHHLAGTVVRIRQKR